MRKRKLYLTMPLLVVPLFIGGCSASSVANGIEEMMNPGQHKTSNAMTGQTAAQITDLDPSIISAVVKEKEEGFLLIPGEPQEICVTLSPGISDAAYINAISNVLDSSVAGIDKDAIILFYVNGELLYKDSPKMVTEETRSAISRAIRKEGV